MKNQSKNLPIQHQRSTQIYSVLPVKLVSQLRPHAEGIYRRLSCGTVID